jgi:hypothetical protein
MVLLVLLVSLSLLSLTLMVLLFALGTQAAKPPDSEPEHGQGP